MKFRNPETGEVFKNLQQASDAFCSTYDSYCQGCPIDKVNGGCACWDWIQEHPYEAARLMGYEVVEENSNKLKETLINGNKEEVNMDKQARPRICEVLGVEVGERFRIDYPKGMTVWLHINKEGFVVREGGPKNLKIGNSVAWAINHPDRIIRKPRWTQQEVERARAIKVLYPDAESLEEQDPHVKVLNSKFVIAAFDTALFPSLRTGETVKLSDMIGGGQ